MDFELVILKAAYSLVGTSGFLDGVFVFCARFLVYISTFIFLSKLLVHREPYERLTKIFYTTFALILSVGIPQGIINYFVVRGDPAAAVGFQGLLEAGSVSPAFATTWAVAVATIAGISLSKRLSFWLMMIAILLGFSQLYTGIYWPLDIVVSFILGILGPIFAKRIIPPVRS